MPHQNRQLLSVTFVVPTYQAAQTLSYCLESVFSQDYPRDKIEVIVVDGGSSDRTIEIASKHDVKILPNPSRFEDGPNGGKAIGARNAVGDLLCFLDSDNTIYPTTWLRAMVQPFLDDPNVVVCETSRLLRKDDPAINRFCSFYVIETPSRDPFVPFARPQDRRIKTVRECYYTYSTLNSPPSPANGSMIPRAVLQEVGGFDYDTEIMSRLIKKGLNLFAQATCGGVFHSYVPSTSAFICKAIRRSKNFVSMRGRSHASSLFLENKGIINLFFTVLDALLPFRRVRLALMKIRETRDLAWLYYPVTSILAVLVYFFVFAGAGRKGFSRLAGGPRYE